MFAFEHLYIVAFSQDGLANLRIDLSTDQQGLDPRAVSEAYQEFAADLGRFLRGVLRDASLADDALQSTFTRLIEKGGPVASASRKAWLFRVAYNEAMLIVRRQGVAKRANTKIAWQLECKLDGRELDEGVRAAVRAEEVDQVRHALSSLSPDQEKVVRLRIYEGLKFVEIAEKLSIPLGTVLSRMRYSLQRLRKQIEE